MLQCRSEISRSNVAQKSGIWSFPWVITGIEAQWLQQEEWHPRHTPDSWIICVARSLLHLWNYPFLPMLSFGIALSIWWCRKCILINDFLKTSTTLSLLRIDYAIMQCNMDINCNTNWRTSCNQAEMCTWLHWLKNCMSFYIAIFFHFIWYI